MVRRFSKVSIAAATVGMTAPPAPAMGGRGRGVWGLRQEAVPKKLRRQASECEPGTSVALELDLSRCPPCRSQSLSDVELPAEEDEEEPSSEEPTTSAASRATIGKHPWHRRGCGGSADSLKNWRRP